MIIRIVLLIRAFSDAFLVNSLILKYSKKIITIDHYKVCLNINERTYELTDNFKEWGSLNERVTRF